MHPGRNDPCPCGSGKKYKKCCMKKEERARTRSLARQRATARVLEWMADHYDAEIHREVQTDFLGDLLPGEIESLSELPEGLAAMLRVNIGDWLLAEACIEVEGQRRRLVDLALGPGGVLLSAEDRAWVERIASQPMGLYEVVAVDPGKGVEVKDLLDPEGRVLWVVERSGSKSLDPWTVLGARVVEDEGEWVFSGGLYPLEPQEGLECLRRIRAELAGRPVRSHDEGRIVRRVVVEAWIQRIIAAVRPPVLRFGDLQTGEPLVFVTDHYRVRDWDALEERLAGRDDVEGDREEGWSWLEGSPGDDLRRIRAALTPKGGDRLEVFARTLARADEARAWLEGLAGDLVTHRVRDTVDPMTAMKRARGKPPAKPPEPELPPDVLEELRERAVKQYYENWADQPIPALGGKTPREAVQTPEGREAVVALLKSYDQKEAERVRREGGRPMDFGFLWKQVGLEREGRG